MIGFFFMNDGLERGIGMMGVYGKIMIGFRAGQFILVYVVWRI